MEVQLENTIINDDDIVISKQSKKLKIKKPKIIEKLIIEECDNPTVFQSPIIIINKGTGAGGANTNLYGKKFEEKTNNLPRLLENGYKREQYITKTFEDKTIIFVSQHGLKNLLKDKYNIDLFRCPDEAYIIEYKSGRKVIKILEKKEQNVSGSCETKLWASLALKMEYEIVLGSGYEVEYALCVSLYLQKLFSENGNKKYTALQTILNKFNIPVLFGDDENYFTNLDLWINK